jgi:O-antigen/teichoic acid export membrane protein
MLIGILIGCLVSLIFGIQPAIQRNISNGQIDQSLGIKFLKFGFPITVWLFISNLFNLADRFLIEHFFNLEVVGTYSAVYDFIYKISGFLCMPVLLAFHPAITKKWNDGFSEDAFRLIKKALFFEVLLTVAVAIFFYFFGEYFFHTVIHLKATNLLGMIVPLVISSMLWQMAMLIHKPLELHLATLVMLLGITLSMFFNIALNIYLLPIYGYQIAAITTLAGTCFYIIYTLFANRLVTNKFRK